MTSLFHKCMLVLLLVTLPVLGMDAFAYGAGSAGGDGSSAHHTMASMAKKAGSVAVVGHASNGERGNVEAGLALQAQHHCHSADASETGASDCLQPAASESAECEICPFCGLCVASAALLASSSCMTFNAGDQILAWHPFSVTPVILDGLQRPPRQS